MHNTNYKPIVGTACLALGFVIGTIYGLGFFTDKMVGNWVPLIGAAGGAATTVAGMAWLSVWRDARAKAEARDDVVRSMFPYLITLRAMLAKPSPLMDKDMELDNQYFRENIAKAHEMWRLLLPMLSQFYETALQRYRMDSAFEKINESKMIFEVKGGLQEALKIASNLEIQFDAIAKLAEARKADGDDLHE